MAITTNQDVRRLYIPVEHAVLMGVRKAIKDTDRNRQRFLKWQRTAVTRTHHFREVTPPDEFHVDDHNAIDFVYSVNGYEGWMS
jgi:hypothetical protein